MYEAFFQLQGRPFLAAPLTDRYFPATVIEGARQTLCRSIQRAEGPGLIVGPSGTGKTLLCQMLAEEFSGRFAVALLTGGRLSSRQALLQAIFYELGLPYRGLDEGELRLSLLDHLEPKHTSHEGLLLVIDEAHTLPWRLLEEVRMLTNLVRDALPRVRVVLAGGPQLEERFAGPNLSSFAQRLAARCYLESLDSLETADYVRSQVSAVGGDAAQLFHDDALRGIYRATDGVPRLINQVCDHALILAGLGGMRRLTSDAIEEAWADLQQLPSPWTPTRKTAAATEIVEFGDLDDLQDEPREAIPFRATAPRQLQVAEPDEQLEQIAEQLSTIEETFQPAGSIGTEVEIDFPEFGDPFGEEFVEEEVVLERYNPDVDIFSTAPRVSSVEGQQLGSLLEPLTAADPWAAVKKPAIVDVGEVADDLPPPTGNASIARLTDPLELDEPPRQPLENPPAAVCIESLAAIERSQAVEPDLIVVEEEPRVTESRAKPASDAQSQRQEYRQLFAKLRRG